MFLKQRKAKIEDLPRIIQLLFEDELGQNRESFDIMNNEVNEKYIKAFNKINEDPNQYLMVVLNEDDLIIGTCQLSILPSLSLMGAIRMQIESVRVNQEFRGMGIGKWMFDQALEFARNHEVSLVQLMTNKTRIKARKFYENLGFEATHDGMKLFLS